MLKRAFVAAAAGLLAAAPASAITINLNGVSNASLDGSNAVTVALGPGTYTLRFIEDDYTAFSRFAASSGCDSNGANCPFGWENSARLIINGNTFLFGDGAASGGIGPVSGGGYYDTAARSFGASGQYSLSFTLASPANASFFIYDDFLGDNRGGISLALSVPEPGTWALLIAGFGVIGGAMRRRARGALALG